ncbi:ninein isoform X2 [Phycodurus eques]|nr:ninein isoform X2 [Phycodurus eques]XP_061552629.1 ninein isoform X2 [Phycodurus eques]XP_061552630.1 ninein isoform X2 [Phycodurus eques]
MDDVLEQDQYEERLKEVFDGFDASGCGSLCPEELADLCLSLHLEDTAPALLDALLQARDSLTERVNFDQFKDALILVLSSGIKGPQVQQEVPSRPESPDIQPKFVKGSKRYGRRSKPELVNTFSDEDAHNQDEDTPGNEDTKDNYDSAIPRKRERWNADETSTEEYEAEGQLHLWNPDEPSTPRGCVVGPLKERLQEACEELAISWHGCAGHMELIALCDYLGLEISADVLHGLNGDGWINVQEFVSMVLKYNKPATPSASTPYRQLKRHHSTQPFDEVGRRIATHSTLTSSIGTRLFSNLDDGTGFTPVESIMDAWMEEGIENSIEILQALNFGLDGKLSLSDLTFALENELLATKNGIHQAALASFKAEIRHLLERIEGELREKEKIRSDLEKAERLKTQLATEVDEHHSSIEHKNNLNLRKLEEEHREKLAAVRSALMKEMDLIRQQAAQQREALEAEVDKIKEDESFLRDHLSISVKENRCLEMDLLDCSQKLMEAQSQVTQLQASLDNIMKEKFGDLDPGSADFLLQEERIKQLRLGYEAQCRELQDRVDELESELQDFHSVGQPQKPCPPPLSEELESKSPGVESDPGLGSEEVHPFISLSLEAEMMLEKQKQQHLCQMDDLRNQLESKINEFNSAVQRHDDQKNALALQHRQVVQASREELASVSSRERELQSQLEQAELERSHLEEETREEASTLKRQLLEAGSIAMELEEQLRNLQELKPDLLAEMEELRNQHASAIKTVEKKNTELLKARLQELEKKHQEEKVKLEKSWLDCFEREKELLRQSHEQELTARLEEARSCLEEEHERTVKKLTEESQEQRARLDEQNNESLQALLEEAMLRLFKEQEEKEGQLREQRESERLRLQEQHKLREAKLKQEWKQERLQLEEDYESMLQERLDEEREKHEAEKEELEKRLEGLMNLRDESLREMTVKHAEERNALSGMLDKLRGDIAQERQQTEVSFSEKIKQVEDRFSGDQESAAARFQVDILKLEWHYQSELRELSESHAEQKLCWEAQLQRALESAEEWRKKTEEGAEGLREWEEERLELEKVHGEAMQAMVKKNHQLQHQVDNSATAAQTKEIELSHQLNNLHSRLQESLQAKEDLLARSDKQAKDADLLLSQTVEDLQQEREEFHSSHSQLQAQYEEILSISHSQTAERILMLTERDDLKLKIEEMDKLLKQAVDDFELDTKELQEQVAFLMEKLKKTQTQDPGLGVSKNGETLITSTSDNSFSEEDLKVESDPTDEPEEDLLQLKRDASENQDLHVSWTCNTNVPSERSNDLETSNFEEPDDNPEVVLCHGEDREFPETDGNAKDSAFSHSRCQDKDSSLEALGALEFCKEESGPQDVPTSICESSSHKDQDSEDDPGSEIGLDDFNGEHKNVSPKPFDQVVDDEPQNFSIFELQCAYCQTREECLLMREKILLLQQKTELLQSLLEHNSKKIQTGREYLEENYSLKVKMFLLMEHINVLEMKASKLKELQTRYEDCLCENAKLKGQNAELKKKVWKLQSSASDERISLTDDISRMRQENRKLSELFMDFEAQRDTLDLGFPPSRISEASCVDDICGDFEVQTTELHKAISELPTTNTTTRANRHKVEQLNQEKVATEQAAENFHQQMCDLHSQSQQLQDENGMLADKNARSLADVEKLKRQLAELIKDNERKEVFTGEEKKELLACVCSLEAELTKALKDTAKLEDRNAQLVQQVSGLEEKLMQADSMETHLCHLTEERKDAAKETRGLRKQLAQSQQKVKNMDDTLHAFSHQRACLRSDLRSTQQDRDSLRQEVAMLHKQLQNVTDENHVLELALHKSAVQSPSRKLQRDDTLQPKEQDDKVSILSPKQLQQHRQSQAVLLKTLEQENASLKQEVYDQKLVIKNLAAQEGHAQMAKLQEENEALKAQIARLTAQLFESFQAHFIGLLPVSPHRTARGHRSDSDNAQDDQDPRMERMEARMEEIETSLHNVKLHLREKVAQLKDQGHKNSRVCTLIRDLYVESGQLLKALEAAGRRRRTAE